MFDGLTGVFQDKLKAKHSVHSLHMMFAVNVYAAVYVAIGVWVGVGVYVCVCVCVCVWHVHSSYSVDVMRVCRSLLCVCVCV